jgi:hypothetical protein
MSPFSTHYNHVITISIKQAHLRFVVKENKNVGEHQAADVVLVFSLIPLD